MNHHSNTQALRQSHDMAMQKIGPDDNGSFVPSGMAWQTGGLSPIQVVLRRKWAILTFAVVVAIIAGVMIRQLKPRYTSVASVVVDARQLRVNGESLLPSQLVDYDLVRTRVEAGRDIRLAEDVVRQLDLTSNPDYCLPHVGLLSRGLGLAVRVLPHGTLPNGWAPAAVDTSPCPTTVTKAAERLAPTVVLSNDARSFVIRVTADASSPELATTIANSYAEAFVNRQRAAIVGLTGQTMAGLTTHLAELRAAVLAADTAVQRARDASQLTLQRGETVMAQRLAELTSQLTAATADLQQKRSTLRTMEAGGVDAGNVARSSPIVQRLLDRQGQLAAHLADLQTRLSANHPQAQAAAAQLAEVNGQLRAEIGKAVAGLRGEVDALEARRASVATEVNTLQQSVTGQGPVSMRVQDLQRDAESVRKQYDAAAARLEQIQADAATQRPDVQLIVRASPPLLPSFPRTNMMTAGVFMSALGLGAALAFVLELGSRVFTTPSQVEQQTGVRVLGLFARPRSRKSRPEDLTMSHPTSREIEALHATLINLLGRSFAADSQASRVVMVTSAVPGEGKSSFSVALGRVGRRSGLSVAILDCDLRRSRFRASAQATAGMQATVPVETAVGEDGAPQVTLDPLSGLSLVTLPRSGPASSPHAVLSRSLRVTLDQLRADYDLVIVDTPPVLALPDALSIGRLVDETVLLTAWRSTRISDVLAALRLLRRAHIQISGMVLTKVEMRALSRKSGAGFYQTAYPTYYGRS